MINVISAGNIITQGESFEVVQSSRCYYTPVCINVEKKIVEPVGQCESYDVITSHLHAVPEVRESLLTQLFATTFNREEHRRLGKYLVDLSDIIGAFAPAGLTIVVWQGASDVKILQSMLGATYNQIRICNVSSRRVLKDLDEFEIWSRSSFHQCIPFYINRKVSTEERSFTKSQGGTRQCVRN